MNSFSNLFLSNMSVRKLLQYFLLFRKTKNIINFQCNAREDDGLERVPQYPPADVASSNTLGQHRLSAGDLRLRMHVLRPFDHDVQMAALDWGKSESLSKQLIQILQQRRMVVFELEGRRQQITPRGAVKTLSLSLRTFLHDQSVLWRISSAPEAGRRDRHSLSWVTKTDWYVNCKLGVEKIV